ncbi:hypothetical protein H072_8089 [Dactylellina haptotyla CBS 200.50]|uniref:Protein kinase domain-containing protein n=1 Tax=Dactylellina haptotyla (strain CBS 200.50) TaxID=1284197 RepID=S8BG08_DACHA|nr:hypothetical protein H072_8089 [Dactylellina haptotyla CBS 200.50]
MWYCTEVQDKSAPCQKNSSTPVLRETVNYRLCPSCPKPPHNSKPDWKPQPPDYLYKDIISRRRNTKILGNGSNGTVYEFGEFAFKGFSTICISEFGSWSFSDPDVEWRMINLAGDCAVNPVGRVFNLHEETGEPYLVGFLTEIGTPLDFKLLSDTEKNATKDEMIQLVTELHQKQGLVHGSIMPKHFLRCKDSKLRLIDFETARVIEEAPKRLVKISNRILSPNKKRENPKLSFEELDDWYALVLVIWEMYTGKTPYEINFENVEEEDVVKQQAVELTEILDNELRGWMREILTRGGAIV